MTAFAAQSVGAANNQTSRNMMKNKEIDKLFSTYDKAEGALVKKRDELYPAGTKILVGIGTEMPAIVKEGSLYPHQVLTEWGHVGWRFLRKIDEPGDRSNDDPR